MKMVFCAGCQRSIQDRYLLQVLERSWHAQCVRCADCGDQLTAKCFAREGTIYCKQDFFRRFGTKCAACSQGILPTDFIRKAKNQVYHISCLVCLVCQTKPNTGEELYMLDECKFLCKRDYLATRQPPADASPIETKLEDGLFSPNGSESLFENGDEENLIKPNVSLHTSLNSLSQLTINGPNSINSSGSASSPISLNPNNVNNISLTLSNGGSSSLSNGPSSSLLQPSTGQPSSQPQLQQPPPHAPCSVYPMIGSSHCNGISMMTPQPSMGTSAAGPTSLMSGSPSTPGSMLSCNAQLPSHMNENNSPMSANSDDLSDLNASNDMLSVASPSSNPGKRRGPRTTIKAKQLETLKAAFNSTPKPTRHVREALANETGLNMRVIQVWFQNRRSKERRLKQLNTLGSRRGFFRASRSRNSNRGIRCSGLEEDAQNGAPNGQTNTFSYFSESSNPGEYYNGSMSGPPQSQHPQMNSFYEYPYGAPPPNAGPPVSHPNSMDVPLSSSLLNGLGDPQAPNAPQPIFSTGGGTSDSLSASNGSFLL